MAAGTGFPYVLYDLLKKESSSIVMWTSTGTAFGIRNMAAFRQEVLTSYFKHNKFSSFQRQLNLYGFRKVVKGRESGCYMHPSFLRDHPEKLVEVKRGVVPPCPPHYSRKIYGSGPRFMSQDDGSDSEPELIVQPRRETRPESLLQSRGLSGMTFSPETLAAARAQIRAEGAARANSGSTGATTAAHHIHQATQQSHLRGSSPSSRPPVTGVGTRLELPRLSASSNNLGRGGMNYDLAEHRSRSARSGLTKMFGSASRSASASAVLPSLSTTFAGASQSGNGCKDMDSVQQQHPQREVQQQQQQQQHVFQQNHQHKPYNVYNVPGYSDLHHDSRDQVNQGGPYMESFTPPATSSMGGRPGSGGGDANGDRPGGGLNPRVSASTAGSLSKLLDGLEQTLESPADDEMYMPIDKRNSFCAQMVNIAQWLDEDPSMQAAEASKDQLSCLAHKRRSSVSELAAYLQDMLEEGESTRLLPPTVNEWEPSGDGSRSGDFLDGDEQRQSGKRTHDAGYSSSDGLAMTSSSGGEMEARRNWMRDTGEDSLRDGSSPHGFPKRARGSPMPPPPAGAPSELAFPSRKRSSELARLGIMETKPSVVQALTCLASGLETSSDSEDGGRMDSSTGAGEGGGPRDERHKRTMAKDGAHGVRPKSEWEEPLEAEQINTPSSWTSSCSEHEPFVQEPGPSAEERATRGSSTRTIERVSCADDGSELAPARRGSTAIDNVLTNFSIDRAIEHFKTEDGTGEVNDPAHQASRQRASVYLLMHAIAVADTDENSADDWRGNDEVPRGRKVSAAI